MNEVCIKKQRQSNLEVLRILSMLLVMMLHYLPLRMPTDAAMVDLNPLKALLNLELHSISIICVHCFILISGYFGIKCRIKSFFSLIFQLLFWAFAGFIIAKYLIAPYYSLNESYSLKDFVAVMFNWYKGRWFVSAYITLYILSPVINSYIEHSTERQLLKFILVFYLYSTIYGYFMRSLEFATGLSAISLMGLYLIGAWLRKSTYNVVKWSKTYDLLGFLICTLILTLGSIALLKTGISTSIYGYLNPVVIIESVFLFQFFRKVQIGHIYWINYLAIGAFSAFLLHCHPYLSEYCSLMWNAINQNFGYSSIFVMLSIVLLYLVSVMIDKIRVIFWNVITYFTNLISNTLSPNE